MDKSLNPRFTYFLLNLGITLGCYFYLVTHFRHLIASQGHDFYSSLAVLALFTCSFFIMLWVNKWPAAFYGLTTFKIKQSCGEALAFTLPILMVIYALHSLVSYTLQQPVRDFWSAAFTKYYLFKGVGVFPGYGLFLLYMALACLQELIVRGGVQGSLQRFLPGRYATVKAIVIANVIYSLSHLYLSPMFALLVFWPGLFWGWLYSRHSNIWGVGLSHGLIGIWCLYMLQTPWSKQLLFH